MSEVPAYPPGTVRALIEADLVTAPTRRALRARMEGNPWAAPRLFDCDAFATLEAACARLIPQPEREQPIGLAGELDTRLVDGQGDGWRYARMPPDRDMHVMGMSGLDQSATAMFGSAFVRLSADDQDAVLRAVQAGQAAGQIWENMDAACYFEELLAQIVDVYYAHPLAQEEIGYAGMADAQGWQAIGIDEREAHEPVASAAFAGAA